MALVSRLPGGYGTRKSTHRWIWLSLVDSQVDIILVGQLTGWNNTDKLTHLELTKMLKIMLLNPKTRSHLEDLKTTIYRQCPFNLSWYFKILEKISLKSLIKWWKLRKCSGKWAEGNLQSVQQGWWRWVAKLFIFWSAEGLKWHSNEADEF